MLTCRNFDNEFTKTAITNCGIEIWNELFTLKLLDETNIREFTLNRTNNGVCDSVPSDTCSFTILRWSLLDASIKSYIQNINDNFGLKIVILFKVGGHTTENGIGLYIKDCIVNKKKDEAMVSCVSQFEYWGRAKSKVRITHILDSVEIAPPPNMTYAEGLQHIGVGLGKGVRFKPLSQNDTFASYEYVSLATLGADADMGFAYLNIFDCKEFRDQNYRGGITFYGMSYVEGAMESFIGEGEAPTGASPTTSLSCDGYFYHQDKQYEVTGWTDYRGGDWRMYPQAGGAFFHWNASYTPEPNVTYVPLIKGIEVEYKQPETSDNQPIMKCCTLFQTSQKLVTAQARTRAHYSFDYFECEGRIDPRIEPLDKIYIDEIGKVYVEQVTINFNGGFTGSIKGRLFGTGTFRPTNAVSISNLSYSNGGQTFSFDIVNPNYKKIIARIHLSDGTYVDVDVNSRTTLSVTQSTCNELVADFVKFANNELYADIYVETIDYDFYNIVAEDTTIILPKVGSQLFTPIISNFQYGLSPLSYSFDVTNNNPIDVTLCVVTSGRTTSYINVPANSTATIDQDDLPLMADSVIAYANNNLADDVYCYFDDYSHRWEDSDNEIILEAQY